MTEIKLIFSFPISEIVYPLPEFRIHSDKKLNIISGDRIRNDFLKSKNEVAEKINHYINNGELIPTEYWCPFWTEMITEGDINIFTSMIGNLEQFNEFEKCINSKNYVITEIIYLKLKDIFKLTEIAKQKYYKIYDNSEILKEDIERYNQMREEVINYADSKYKVTINDFFTNKIFI